MTQLITKDQWALAHFGTANAPTSLDQANDRITFALMVKALEEAKAEVKAVQGLLTARNIEINNLKASSKVLSAELEALKKVLGLSWMSSNKPTGVKILWHRLLWSHAVVTGLPDMKSFAHLSFEERFLSKINIDSLDKCWLPKTSTKGRPNISFRGVGKQMSHLVLEELAGLKRPPGLVACHSCDEPKCCNPTHLRWGTYSENNLDMVLRGRWVGPTGKSWTYTSEQRLARCGNGNGRYKDGKYAKIQNT